MIRWGETLDFLLHPRVRWLAIGAALTGWSSVALAGFSEISVQVAGVPMPVLLAAAAGAFFARAYGSEMSLDKAAAVVLGWTFAGCTGAPLLQAGTVFGLKKYLDFELSVPGGFLAFAALAISSVAWWGPVAWPYLQRWLPEPKTQTPPNPPGGGA